MEQKMKGFAGDKYLTQSINIFIYLIGLCCITFYGIYVAVIHKNILQLVLGILIIVMGNMIWRVLCELIDVQFKIYNELKNQHLSR